MDEFIRVIEVYNLNRNGSRDLRLSRVGIKWYVYTFDFETGNVQFGNSTAQHTPAGLASLFIPMSEAEANSCFANAKASHQEYKNGR